MQQLHIKKTKTHTNVLSKKKIQSKWKTKISLSKSRPLVNKNKNDSDHYFQIYQQRPETGRFVLSPFGRGPGWGCALLQVPPPHPLPRGEGTKKTPIGDRLQYITGYCSKIKTDSTTQKLKISVGFRIAHVFTRIPFKLCVVDFIATRMTIYRWHTSVTPRTRKCFICRFGGIRNPGHRHWWRLGHTPLVVISIFSRRASIWALKARFRSRRWT